MTERLVEISINAEGVWVFRFIIKTRGMGSVVIQTIRVNAHHSCLKHVEAEIDAWMMATQPNIL
jgi:hypothetical protein